MRYMKSLVEEARTLATIINTSRFLGEVPSVDSTVRLLEVIDLMAMEGIVKLENPEGFCERYKDVLLPVMKRLADR